MLLSYYLIGEWLIRKDLEENCTSLIVVLFHNLPEVAVENHEKSIIIPGGAANGFYPNGSYSPYRALASSSAP
jgi:hypothetical protein